MKVIGEDKFSKIPENTQDLVEYLEYYFKNKVPDISDTEREIWISVGTIKVIDHIKTALQSEEDQRELDEIQE